jgi:hypothetical protein
LFCRGTIARAAGPAVLALALAHGPAPADTRLGDVELLYGFSLAGVPIAEIQITMTLGESSYEVSGNGRTVGLVDLFSRIRFSGSSKGTIEDGAVRPKTHTYRYAERSKAREVTLTYDDRQVPSVTASPEFSPSFDRVPLPDARLIGTIDLASQFIAPAVAGKAALAPDHCVRAYAVFDGRLRVDAALSYLRASPSARLRGVNYSGPVMHCAMRIRPVGGHREGDMLSKIAAGGEIGVWAAPAFGGRFYIPIKVAVPTPVGTVEVAVRRMRVVPADRQAGLGDQRG